MLFRFFRKLLFQWGLYKVSAGKGNETVASLRQKKHDGWVSDVTAKVVWIKEVDAKEKKERRKRFFTHWWRLFLEKVFKKSPDHTNRYTHQIFLVELVGHSNVTLRVENNLSSGKEVRGLIVGSIVHLGGEYLFNEKGGKLHHTHGNKGFAKRLL